MCCVLHVLHVLHRIDIVTSSYLTSLTSVSFVPISFPHPPPEVSALCSRSSGNGTLGL